jgi:hypothetical protein
VGGKSKAVTVGYKHYLGEHMVLCHGPIDNITRIRVDERVAWQGSTTGGSITVDAEDLFGGESREGGVSGTVDIAMGGPSQTQNSYLVSVLGSTVPAYRGVVSAILRKCYLGNNPYLKKWSFRGTRVMKSTGGATQWYSGKASIVGASVLARNATWDYQITTVSSSPPAIPSSGWDNSGPAPFGQGTGFSAPYPVNTEWPHTTGLWLRKTISVPLGGTLSLHGHVENACYIFLDGELVHSQNAGNAQVSTLQEFTIDLVDLEVGEHELAVYATDDLVSGQNTYFYLEDLTQVDMNPAHMIRECLTDPDWGMGYLSADIDSTSFEAAADTLYDEGLGMSLLWDRQITIEAFIQEIVRHIDAALYVDRKTGKFVLKLIRADYDEGSLITLDESNVSKVTNPSKLTFGELVNSVTVNYWDSNTAKDASISVQDTALVQMQGAVIGTTLQYPGFSNGANAALAAQRDLRVLSAPFLSCTIYADSTAKDLNIGDTFKFSWDRWQIGEMIMRVTGIAFGDGKSNQVRITCTQDVYATPVVSTVQPSGGGWVDPSRPPTAISATMATEAPYLELVQTIGEAQVNSSLAGKSDIGYVLGAAPRPSSAINGRIWTDGDGTYIDVGGFDFCPYAQLDEDIDKHETVLSYTAGSDLDQVTLGTWCQIDDELMRVDAINTGAGTITVGRGVLDTVPEFHTTGADIFFWDEFSGYDPTEYVEGETINVKLQPVSGSGTVALSSIMADAVEIVGRPYRPYAPGDFQVNAESYEPDQHYFGELALTWVHRDRLQQTGGTLADHYDAGIGPEDGTVYRVQGLVSGIVVDEIDDISGTSHSYTPSVTGVTYTVRVHAKRDGVYSYQAPSHTFQYGGDPEDFIDDFNRANENLEASSDWTRIGGTAGAAQIISNALHFTSSTDATAYVGPSYGSPDHFVQAKRPSATEAEWFLACRIQDGNNFVGARLADTDSGWAVYKRVGGTFTVLGRWQMTSVFKTDSIARLEVIGDEYQLIVDGKILGKGTIGTHADTATAGGFICRNDTTPNPAWDDFSFGLVDTFTVPDARTSLLISFDGADEATTATDESAGASALVFNGNAKLDNGAATLGYTTSLLLDGNGDYITMTSRTDHELPIWEDWTVECWIRLDSVGSGLKGVIGKRSGSSVGWQIYLDTGVPRILLWGSSSIDASSSGGALSTGTWYHLAMTQEGSTVRFFVNGTKVIETTRTGTHTIGNTGVSIGRDAQNTGRNPAGRIQEVRIRKGEAVYTANFTPPASPLPRS